MKVKLKKIYAGPHGTGSPNQIIELPDSSAKALIDSGDGESVDKPVAEVTEMSSPVKQFVETADTKPQETQEAPKRNTMKLNKRRGG